MSQEAAAIVEGLHPLGEGVFSFPTAGGRVGLSVTDDALTPYWAADCPVKRTGPNAAPAYDVIQSFMLTALSDGFSHVEWLREDPTIPELFGLESVVSDDTVRRFFPSIDPGLGAEWINRQVRPLWRALPEQIILDWDSTVLIKYGRLEGRGRLQSDQAGTAQSSSAAGGG